MSEKRKDKKGRVLHTGESQRSDGRYCYRYTDLGGNRKTIYSWKLVATDKPQEGKSLRELEKEVSIAANHGIFLSEAKRYSVDDAFTRFLDVRRDLKLNTRVCYKNLYEKHIQPILGFKSISNVKRTDISRLYSGLVADGNLKGSSLEKLHSILYQVFDICVEDKLLLENPAAYGLKKLRKTIDMSSEKRHALTETQQEKFVEFIRSTPKYEPYSDIFTVLLGTGVRIGELLGLCDTDCDFRKDRIIIDHSLSYKPDEEGKYSYRIGRTKTTTGNRIVPMLPEVKLALQNRCKNLSNFSIDGYTGFIFTNGSGKPYTPAFIYDRIQIAVREFNQQELVQAVREDRDPELLPKISAHNLRHTFCTRLCENVQDVKVIQEVMGHKNSRTTFDTYNETTESRKRSCFEGLEGKIKLV